MAFRTSAGKLILQLLNSGSKPVLSRLEWRDRALQVDLPGISITTLTWQK
jgi:hypothetical protein